MARRLTRLSAGLGAAVLAALCVLLPAGPAAANLAPTGGLKLDLRGADPLHPSMVLTNAGPAACSVVAGSLGTLSLSSVVQGGQAVTPEGAQASSDEGFAYSLMQQLKTLQPNESVEVPLTMLDWGVTGHTLQTVTWSPSAGGYAWFYPIAEGQPLTLVGTYAIPQLDLTGKPAACEAAVDGAQIGSVAAPPKKSDSGEPVPPWAWIAGGGLVVLLAMLLVMVGWMRRSQVATAGGPATAVRAPLTKTPQTKTPLTKAPLTNAPLTKAAVSTAPGSTAAATALPVQTGTAHATKDGSGSDATGMVVAHDAPAAVAAVAAAPVVVTAAPDVPVQAEPLSGREQRRAEKQAAREARAAAAAAALTDPPPQRIPTRTKSRKAEAGGPPPAAPSTAKEIKAAEAPPTEPPAPITEGKDKGDGGIAGVISLIVFAGALAAVLLPAKPAYATVVPTPALQSAWKSCNDLLHQDGHDPAGIMQTVDDSTIRIDLAPGKPTAGSTGTAEYGLSPKHMLVTWNTNDFHQYIGAGGTADPCDSLYHELYHAYQHANGTFNDLQCVTAADGPTGISVADVEATLAQNKLRVSLGKPARSHYGDKKLPTGDCQPPPDPTTCHDPERDKRIRQAPMLPGTPMMPAAPLAAVAPGTTRDGCGESNGDPHLRTLDGRRYDFQAAGEFVLSRDQAAGFEVQARQQVVTGSTVATVTTAVAMAVGSPQAANRVEVQLDETGALRLLVGGANVPLGNNFLPSGGYVQSDAPAGRVTVFWPDGSVVDVAAIGRWGLRVSVEPSTGHDGKLDGLLGNLNNDPADDLRVAGGDVITDTSFANLYPKFADSWRVAGPSSLFTYADGQGTDTYTDRAVPQSAVTVDQLPNREAAETACRQFGVTDPAVLTNCTFDVALTGQPDFAAAAAAGQGFAAGVSLTGTEWTLNVGTANGTATAQFDGTAGQRAFIDVLASTLPDQCGSLSLKDPSGAQLATGCIAAGRGYLDGVVLPATGKYTITMDPVGSATGQTRVRLYLGKDQAATLTNDAPPVTTKIDLPGTVYHYTFTGTAGQKIFLDASAVTFPDQCGILVLRGPDNSVVAAGCTLSGTGFIDGTVLPTSGTYTLSVDPSDRGTGSMALSLITVADQRGTIAVNGPDVAVNLEKPGAAAYFTFTGAGGQQLTIDVTDATLVDQCGAIIVRNSTDQVLATGCLTAGRGTVASFVLPTTGTYTVVVDPADRGTGTAKVRLHT